MSRRKDRLARTTITRPASLKEKMQRTDMAEAVILNERLKRPAPKDWSALKVVKRWRRRTNS